MTNWTRKALNLSSHDGEAEAVEALNKRGCTVTLRQLEKEDVQLVMYLRASAWETYARLFKAQYGKDPKPFLDNKGLPIKKELSAAVESELQMSAWRSGREKFPLSLSQMEKSHRALLHRIQKLEPKLYDRLVKEHEASQR